jgi:EAL domain
LPASRLELEITESTIIADKTRALHILRQIKALGVTIALDDFGTGYSSLETLRSFPFDKIKLDRLFMNEVETNPQSKAMVRAVLALQEPGSPDPCRRRRDRQSARSAPPRRLRRGARLPARPSRTSRGDPTVRRHLRPVRNQAHGAGCGA